MDQFIQQDPFGSDQDEWDGSDLSLGCDDSRRRQMSHATFRKVFFYFFDIFYFLMLVLDNFSSNFLLFFFPFVKHVSFRLHLKSIILTDWFMGLERGG